MKCLPRKFNICSLKLSINDTSRRRRQSPRARRLSGNRYDAALRLLFRFDEISGSMRKSLNRRHRRLKLRPVGFDKGARDWWCRSERETISNWLLPCQKYSFQTQVSNKAFPLEGNGGKWYRNLHLIHIITRQSPHKYTDMPRKANARLHDPVL